MDGVDAFHAAYHKGRFTPPPTEYMDLILIPQHLHIDPMTFDGYPRPVQARIRNLLTANIRYGWGGNLDAIERKHG